MVKKVKTIIILLCLTTIVFAQKNLDISYMECSYRLTLMKDTVRKIKTVKDHDMRLLIGEKYSKFYSHTTFVSDSVRISKQREENLGEHLQKYPLGEFYEIYKNYAENTIATADLMQDIDYVLCKEPLQKQEWKIMSETKQIAGYKCQKSTCRFRGRDYVAWFTREIPVSEGPHKFSGLPGLIIKIYDTKEHYDFELYSVRRVKKDIVFNPFEKLDKVKYQEVTLKDYIRILRNYHANPFAGDDVIITRADGTTYIPRFLFAAMELEEK